MDKGCSPLLPRQYWAGDSRARSGTKSGTVVLGLMSEISCINSCDFNFGPIQTHRDPKSRACGAVFAEKWHKSGTRLRGNFSLPISRPRVLNRVMPTLTGISKQTVLPSHSSVAIRQRIALTHWRVGGLFKGYHEP